MYRPEIKLWFVLLFLSIGISACGTTKVLDLPRNEAFQRLRSGEMAFITDVVHPLPFERAIPRLQELTRIHQAAPFYAGLIAGSSPYNDKSVSMRLFAAALESSSIPARRESILKLIRLILESDDPLDGERMLALLSRPPLSRSAEFDVLRSASLYRLTRYHEARAILGATPETAWEQALAFFAQWQIAVEESSLDPSDSETKLPEFALSQFKHKVLGFLVGLPTGDTRRWAYAEALSFDGFLDSGARALISTRLSPAPHSVNLRAMDAALENGGLVFFRYPALIADLGRAFQFTPSRRNEGSRLLQAWAELLRKPPQLPSEPDEYLDRNAFVRTLDREAAAERRYLLLHYAGRIERAQERYAESTELFWQALELAPDAAQGDACIWYILMNTLNTPANELSAITELVRNTLPRWETLSSFDDVLDRLSAQLVVNRQWESIAAIFASLEEKNSSSALRAQYAWITGRAVEEGFLATGKSASDYFRLIFGDANASFYYRTMAALKLGSTLNPETNTRRTSQTARSARNQNAELDFLLGMFEHGASAFALPYLHAVEAELSPAELRHIAHAMAESRNWQESLRLVARYIRRQGYERTREDLQLLYPRPFIAPIEQFAAEMNIASELLFALIRTESFFRHDAVSPAGAIGLAQFMPSTAQDMATRLARSGGIDHRSSGGIDLTNPEVNINLGAFYLNYLKGRTGSPMLAFLAYNGGQGRVRRWISENDQRKDGALPDDLFLETVPLSETRQYGRLVLGAAAVYGHLYYDTSMTDVAEHIYRRLEVEVEDNALAD